MGLTRSHHLSFIFIFFSLLEIHASFAQTAIKAGYWFRDSGITVSDIDSTYFTHLLCSFADVDGQTGQVTISADNLASFSNFSSIIRKKNPFVRAILSIGGGNVASAVFNSMASRNISRNNFTSSSIALARTNGFSGLDLDWENLSNTTETSNMAVLLKEWRAAVDAEVLVSHKTRLLLTAAVSNSPQLNSVATLPVSTIKSTLSWVNIMAYDFASPAYAFSRNTTGAPAALFNPLGNSASGSQGVQAWLNAGLPATQIVLGFPFFGYAWKLTNPANHGISSPANGIDSSVGSPGDGSLQYNQILSFISAKNAVKVFSSSYVMDYCYAGTSWIGYDDTQSIAGKVSFAKSKGLRGYFAWHVAGDFNWTLSRLANQTWGA